MSNTQYIVITLSDYTDTELSKIDVLSDTFISFSRKNKNGTKAIAKITSDSTGNFDSLIASLTMYSKEEIIDQILSTSDWSYAPSNTLLEGHPGPEPLDD